MSQRIVLRGRKVEAPKKRGGTENKVRSASSSSLPKDKDRLNLQIDKGLKRWAQDYAKKRHTSLTQLITDHFVNLQKEEEGDGVEQI
jgi:hypothetical protein